jgi:hypothetical protein
MEINGRVFKIGGVTTGSGQNGPWSKLEFVIETEEKYPKKVCFSAWNERVEDVQKIKVGDAIKVSFDVSSREYNEKWYTDLRAWKIEVGGGASAPSQSPPTYTSNAAPASSPAASAPAAAADDNDDLPF